MKNRKAKCVAVALFALGETSLPAGAFFASPPPAGMAVNDVILAKAARHGVRPRHHHAGRPIVVVRPWHRRPYYGRIVAGVAIGAIVAAAVVGAPPPPPAPSLCWNWSNNTYTQGYWDYCR